MSVFLQEQVCTYSNPDRMWNQLHTLPAYRLINFICTAPLYKKAAQSAKAVSWLCIGYLLRPFTLNVLRTIKWFAEHNGFCFYFLFFVLCVFENVLIIFIFHSIFLDAKNVMVALWVYSCWGIWVARTFTGLMSLLDSCSLGWFTGSKADLTCSHYLLMETKQSRCSCLIKILWLVLIVY